MKCGFKTIWNDQNLTFTQWYPPKNCTHNTTLCTKVQDHIIGNLAKHVWQRWLKGKDE
jgi:hypothetical protein